MKGCNTPDEFNWAIENGDIINDVRPNQTAETTVAFLNNTQERVEKADGKYQVKDAINVIKGVIAKIKESVTEKVGRKIPYQKENPLLEQQGLIGNYTHESAELITRQILLVTKEKSTDAAITYIKGLVDFDQEGLKKIAGTYGKQFDQKSMVNLFEGIKEMLLTLYKQQRTINRLTGKDGKVTILSEQILIDARRGIGGTADIIAIFSDNTAGIVHFKTKILGAWNRGLGGKILDGDKVITRKALERYKLQTGEYGRILRESYGVESIRSVVILPIKLNVDLDPKTGEYRKQITGLAFPGQDPLLAKVLPFSNKTGFKELDEYVLRIDERIKKLEARIKADYKLRDELQPRIKQ